MFDQSRRRWASVESTFVQGLVFSGKKVYCSAKPKAVSAYSLGKKILHFGFARQNIDYKLGSRQRCLKKAVCYIIKFRRVSYIGYCLTPFSPMLHVIKIALLSGGGGGDYFLLLLTIHLQTFHHLCIGLLYPSLSYFVREKSF